MKKPPLFIGGCSRSGTTLLASMLGSSEELVIPESHFKVDILKKIKPNATGLYPTKEVARYIEEHGRYKIWCCSQPIYFDRPEMEMMEIMDTVASHYAKQHNIQDFSSWIDHTPGNMTHAPILSLLFPGSKFIHIVRDGRGFASSVKKLDWGFHDLLVIGRYWRDNLIRDLNIESALQDKVLRVYYEDLVTNPESTLKQICTFVQTEYSEEMLKANGFITPSYTKKQHNLIGKGVNKSRAHAWRTSLTKREIELFESVAAGVLEDLGYDLLTENPSSRLTPKERVFFKIRNFFYKYYDEYRQKKRYQRNLAKN